MRFGLEGAVRRRILAALLAGIMVFSQTGTAFAAENAAAADTAVEAAAEEEPEAEAAAVEEPEEPEGEKEPEVAPEEGAENEDTSADEIQDEVTTDDEEPGDTVVDESEETAAEEESVEEADEGITEEAAAETDETVEEPEEEVAAKESKKEEDYSIEICEWESAGLLFEDGEWSCPIALDGFDGVQYDLQPSVSDHNGPENADTEDACRIEGEPGNMSVTWTDKKGNEQVSTAQGVLLAAGRIACGLQDVLELGNLNSKRDWGYAKDYVECMWLMLQHERAEDFVIATGVQHTVREFTTLAFAHDGIELVWSGEGLDEVGTDKASGRVLVRVNPAWYRPTDVDNLWGDPSKARTVLGWNPQKTSYEELCALMADYDLKLAKKEAGRL